MGTVVENTDSGLAAALFTPVQQRVLGLLFGQPERRFQSAELIRLADSGTGAVHRQLQRLEASGLVLATHAGNQKYYQADPKSPIFPELRGLVEKTVGIVEPIRAALEPLSRRIAAAFVYGSLAKGSDRAHSDLDLLVLSDDLEYADVFAALEPTEAHLSRPVHPTVMTRAEWRGKRARNDSFVARIASQLKLFVIGGENDLA
ncbi:MAG: winged helix-turn-helix domain-containing protein [Acidobacteriota bacterium]